MAEEAVKNKRIIHGQLPGLRANVYVRAIDGNGNKGDWSEPVEVTAGMTGRSQLEMSGSLTLAAAAQGVRVSWDSVSGAFGYIVFANVNNVNYPDVDTIDDIFYQGRSRNIVIPAENGDSLKVRVMCYDAIGWRSSDYIQGTETSGTPT